MTSARGTIIKNPEVGLGVVGKKTLTCSLPNFAETSSADEVSAKLGSEHVNVFLPTTPNPTSGFFMIVPRADVIELEMGVEEALKHIVSMGSVPPLSQSVPSAK